MDKRKTIKVMVFGLIFICLFLKITRIVRPDWFVWNHYDTVHGFYKEPKNTMETVFLGSSVTANGIIPAQLYEEQGICAYNLGMEQQPMLASYYWLKEAYRLHPKTLKTVVLDASMLRRTPKESFYRKALDDMHFSKIKYEAIRDHTSGFKAFMSYMLPVLSYHDRWKSLTETDFRELNYKVPRYMRGYNFTAEKLIDHVSGYQDILMPSYRVNDNRVTATFDKESLDYLNRMNAFSKDHHLQLILIKTPVSTKGRLNWTDADHLGVQQLADDYGVSFLDFNYEPLVDEIGYNHATDSREGIHLNYYGARKFTRWFGRYLTENCKNTDIRGNKSYTFMETELADYRRKCEAEKWKDQIEPGDLEQALKNAENAGKTYEQFSPMEQQLYLYDKMCDEKRVAYAGQDISGDTEE